jgi:hypothetical protein
MRWRRAKAYAIELTAGFSICRVSTAPSYTASGSYSEYVLFCIRVLVPMRLCDVVDLGDKAAGRAVVIAPLFELRAVWLERKQYGDKIIGHGRVYVEAVVS